MGPVGLTATELEQLEVEADCAALLRAPPLAHAHAHAHAHTHSPPALRCAEHEAYLLRALSEGLGAGGAALEA